MRFPRACGCLLHPTSLPGPYGCGDLGASAYRFVDWLEASAQGLWQILPLGETGLGNSPYTSLSAFAGNPLLIDLEDLVHEGWLERGDIEHPDLPADAIDFLRAIDYRRQKLLLAASRFAAAANRAQRDEFDEFCAAHSAWLDDYALFRALAEGFPGRDWCDWDAPLAARDAAALASARKKLATEIAAWKFYQWCFFRQWQRLRDYANARGIRIFGDAPIFAAYHSADVWARRDLFDLDSRGRPRAVAGVPPDYFSRDGQLWGNPLYRWEVHAEQEFAWWTERIRRSFELYDLLRIDHFLGFVNYWEIPADADTAVDGRWLPGPGAALFERCTAELGKLAIVAEDLGSVTPAVTELRRRFGYPGMAVLQFAWRSDRDNPHLPHNHGRDLVVYSGTHDNDTACGWWASLGDAERQFVRAYLDSDCAEPNWELIRCALASPAETAIIPLQDYLGLGSEHRFNVPGVAAGNWRWRFRWGQVPRDLAARIASALDRHGRAAAHG